MIASFIQKMSSKATLNWLKGGMIFLVLMSIIYGTILFPVYWNNFGQWNGFQCTSGLCDDFDPCTSSLCLPDHTCIHRPLVNGTACTNDQCYIPDVTKVCCNGDCKSDRENCKGYCLVDADCDAYPIPLRADMEGIDVTTTCVAQSCVTLISGSPTSDCLSWVSTTCSSNTSNLQTKNCLSSQFDNYASEADEGVCMLSYTCAPLTYPDAKKRSEEGKPAIPHRPLTHAPKSSVKPHNVVGNKNVLGNHTYRFTPRGAMNRALATYINSKINAVLSGTA